MQEFSRLPLDSATENDTGALFAEVVRALHPGKKIESNKSVQSRFFLRNIFFRSIFDCMLYRWDIGTIREFFNRFPFVEEEVPLPEKEMFSRFRDLNGHVPHSYLAKILGELESFLVAIDSCLDELLHVPAREGVVYDPTAYLWALSHFLPVFSRESDPEIGLIKTFASLCNLLLPYSSTQLENFTVSASGAVQARFLYSTDRSTHHQAPLEFPVCQYLYQNMPRCFGGKSFDACRSVFEMKSAEQIVGPRFRTENRNRKFLIDGEAYGVCVPFHEVLRSPGATAGDLSANQLVTVIERDFYCSRRKRIILGKSIAYGAPVGCFEIDHHPSGTAENPFNSIVSDILIAPSRQARLEEKYRELLAALSTALTITYNRSDHSLSYNGKHLSSGVQGRLLREILHLAIVEKRDGFCRREFADRGEFIIDPFSTGLTVRLNRALDLLRELSPYLVVEKQSRGFYRIHASPDLRLIEE